MNDKKNASNVGTAEEILYFKELPSTNDFVKEKRCLKKDLTVIAERQSGGRGTKGRSFSSELGGVYLSKLIFPENMPANRAFELMAGAAVAVCKTLQSYGLNACIKWPNDIHVNGKKICGILIENTLSGKNVSSSIIGIGLNVCNPLPDVLLDIATTMSAQGVKTETEEVAKRLVALLSAPVCMEEYFSFLGYMGKKAELFFGDERISARLLFVDNEGNLHVETANGERVFSAAEVSVRGL